MKKIGIVTIHNSPNYGACLQSYALYRYIKDCGDDVEIIDLHRPCAYADYVPSKKFVPYRQNKRSLKSKIKKTVKTWFGLSQRTSSLYSPAAKKKFDEFNAAIALSKPFRGIDELYENPPFFDLYISGSDQLWNPTQAYCLEPYFLTFVPEGQGQKISYATSIGVTELRENEKADFTDWLKQYDDISVREYQARDMLQTMLGEKPVHQVADPTFLLEPQVWKSLAQKPNVKGKYILLFTLQHRPAILDYCLKLSQQSGIPLVSLGQIQPEATGKSYVAVKNAGPKEFLGYIQYAEMVITDSFHCTVFSLIMGANNFYTYISPTNCRGSRITDLLNTYGLCGHLLPISLDTDYRSLSANELDKDKITEVMSKERERSRRFLNKFL